MVKFIEGNLYNPFVTIHNSSLNQKLKRFILINLFFAVIISLCFKFTDILITQRLIGVNYISIDDSNLVLFNYILSIVFIPIIEEFFFRWGLIFSPFRFSIFVLGLFSEILTIFLRKDIVDKLNNESVLSAIIFISFWLLSLMVINKYKIFIERYWYRYFKLIFIISVILFGYAHITKYNIFDFTVGLVFSPILVLPYCVSGYLFSLARVQFGIFWSIFSHSFVNLTLSILVFYHLI